MGRDVGAKECAPRVGRQLIRAESRGDEPCLGPRIFGRFAAPADRALALKENQQVKMLARTRGSDALGEFPFFGCEVTAGDVVGFSHSATFNAYGINFAAALLAELNNL